MSGALVLVATPIGNLGDLSPRAVDTLQRASLILCEDTRHSGKLLAHAGVRGVRLAVCNEHTEHQRTAEVIDLLAAGDTVALITDAGTPGISDPGSRLVGAVVAAGHDVSAVPGPAAFVMAVTISGLDTSRFVFEGFLPRSGRDRADRLAAIAAEPRTTVLYESPQRIRRTVADLAACCGGERRVAVARELTKLYESVWRGALADAVEAIAVGEPRGEYAVVVEGAPPRQQATDDQIRAALGEAIRGQSRKDAIIEVADRLDVPRRRVYELAHAVDN